MFLSKVVLKICSKFTGKHPCRSVISIKLQISLRHECSPVNLLHIFKTPFYNKTYGGLVPTETVQLICTDNILSAYILVALYYGDLY